MLASLATVAFALAAAGYFGDTSWWPAMLLGGAIVSLALMAVYFTRWWALGIVLSIGLAYYAVQEFTAA